MRCRGCLHVATLLILLGQVAPAAADHHEARSDATVREGRSAPPAASRPATAIRTPSGATASSPQKAEPRPKVRRTAPALEAVERPDLKRVERDAATERSRRDEERDGEPLVRSAEPARVRLSPGDQVTVRLRGDSLERIRRAEVLRAGRPARSLRSGVRVLSAQEIDLVLSAIEGATPARDYELLLRGDRSKLLVSSLRIEVVAGGRAPGGRDPGERERKPGRERPGGEREPERLPGDDVVDTGRERPGGDGGGGRLTPRALVIEVTDEDTDDPIVGASVCLGVPGMAMRYGMRRTDGLGRAAFGGVPENTDVQAVVSKDGYESDVETVELGIDEDDYEEGDLVDVDGIDLDPAGSDFVDTGPRCPPADGSLEVAVTHGEGAVLCVGAPGDVGGVAALELPGNGRHTVEGLIAPTPLEVIVDKPGHARIRETLVVSGPTSRSFVLETLETSGPQDRWVVENGTCRYVAKVFEDPGPFEIPDPDGDPEPEPDPDPEPSARPDLELTLDPGAPVPDGSLHTTLRVYNRGDAPASEIAVSAELPSQVEYRSHATGEGFACTHSASSRRFTCSGGSVAANRFAALTIVTHVDPAAWGTTLDFSAQVDPSDTIVEQDEGDNTAVAQVSTPPLVRTEYAVSGAEALPYATSQGFEHTGVQDGALGHCIVDGHKFEALPPTLAFGNPVCRFDFFQGRRLRAPWRIESVQLWSPDGEPNVEFLRELESGSHDAHFAIRVVGQLLRGEVNQVVLSGPDGTNWRDAFEEP